MKREQLDAITEKVKGKMRDLGIETPMEVDAGDIDENVVTYSFRKASDDEATLEKFSLLSYELGRQNGWDTSIVEIAEGGYDLFVTPKDGADNSERNASCPPFEKNPNPPEQIHMTLAYEFYDAIASGSKRQEWRDCTPYWMRKLLSGNVKRIRFQRGYGGHVGQARPCQMTVGVNGVYVTDFSRKVAVPSDEFDVNDGAFKPAFIRIDLGDVIEPTHRI